MPIDSGDWNETASTAVMADRFEKRQRERNARQSAGEVFDAGEREASRLAQRAVAKKQMAESIRASERRVELEVAIDAVNNEKEQAAAEHVAACAPLQRELETIEAAAIAAITARKPTDSAQEERRRELLKAIEDRNQNLEAAIAAKDRILARLEKERKEAASACREALARIDLIRFASPALKETMAAAVNAQTWAERRHAAAAEKVVIHPNSFAWNRELRASRAELERCNEEVAATEEKMLNE